MLGRFHSTLTPGPACKPRSVLSPAQRFTRRSASSRRRRKRRSSIWDEHRCPPHATYPELKCGGPPHRPCLALLHVGDAGPRTLLRAPVRSYRTFSPSPAGIQTAGNLLLCGPLPSVTRTGCYPARCPPERGLSSGAHRAPATARPALASITILSVSVQSGKAPH